MAAVEKNNGKAFRLSGKQLFLTYPQCTEKKESVAERIEDFFGSYLPLFYVVCEEAHKDGTPHLHCVISLRKKYDTRNAAALDALSGGSHGNYQAVRSLKASLHYIIKAGNYIEHGIDVKAWLKAKAAKQSTKGTLVAKLLQEGGSVEEVEEKYPSYYMHSKRKVDEFFDYCQNKRQKLELLNSTPPTFRPWQKRLMDYLNMEDGEETDQILWFYDAQGGKGKSWMTAYLEDHHGALRLSQTKHDDVAYAIQRPYPKIIVFDLPRDSAHYQNYGTIEEIKNGRIFSGKYHSTPKRFPRPHVIIFANYPPPEGKFSDYKLKLIDFDYMPDEEERQEELPEIPVSIPYTPLPTEEELYERSKLYGDFAQHLLNK